MNSATEQGDRSPGSPTNPLCVAIVGSGPSGFYAAEALLRQSMNVQVDMIERLPVPFGLVRHGVAPDHPKLKQPTLVFDKVARMPGFSFLGNVEVGRDLTVPQLQSTHHAILFACGAEADRRMGIPGEDLPGSHTATEFVGWYNGHPECRDRTFDLSGEVAVIIGQGNVAVDVARILAKPIDELRNTDIATHALQALAESRVRTIHIVGRRGPVQAKFTNKELRELGGLPGCGTLVRPDDLCLSEACAAELADKASFVAAGNVKALQSWVDQPAASGRKQIAFHFLQAPVEIIGTNRVKQIKLERNRLTGEPFKQTAVGTAEYVTLDCDLVFRSIGYRGRALPGVPFDDARGTFVHQDGRVGNAPGLYAAGWIKRGPSGIIGTNRADAVATVNTLMSDLASFDPSPKPGSAALRQDLARRRVRVVDYDDWLRIDAEEQRRGSAAEKPREKFTTVESMLSVLDAQPTNSQPPGCNQ